MTTDKITYLSGEFDELWSYGFIHIERMSDTELSVIIGSEDGAITINIASGSKIDVTDVDETLPKVCCSTDCQQIGIRDELLTACIECDDYATLYARCMELVERGDTTAEQSVDGQTGN